ncbi:MAG: hypothetical protein Q8L48_35465 [Archangium sp.]|nr:hypothetical protein [Archangium sp.]
MVRALVPRHRYEQLAWILALICGVAPLWATQALPLVDLPQHLHLISVLHRLDDASTLYPEIFARRPELTPYLGYYYAVSLLNWLMPLEVANRVFLSAYVAGLPLSLAFLLRSLKRPAWPALLALPFAYGDSFAWGFINYCASLPLALITCGFFVRTIEDAPKRRAWAIALAASLVAVLLFHVQAFAWLGVALPFLLLTTPAPEGRHWRARVPALVGVMPGVILFVLWIGLRVGQPQEIAPGQPWRSWGPMLSKENLGWKSLEQNVGEFISAPRLPDGSVQISETNFPILAGMVPDGSDQRAVRLVFLIALGAMLFGLWRALGSAVLGFKSGKSLVAGIQGLFRLPQQEGPIARWRIVGLAALAVTLYLALPFDIRGYMYYLNTRYAHLVAALLVCSVPALPELWSRRLVYVAAATALVLMGPLRTAFQAFDLESRALTELAKSAGPKPKVMGLVYATGSRAVTHPLYLHAGCVVARERGGLTNFSFALTPHSPLMYRGTPPPTFPSEWRPDQMQWNEQGSHYDHFVLRGVRPEQVFGPRLQSELYVAAQSGDFFLVRKR